MSELEIELRLRIDDLVETRKELERTTRRLEEAYNLAYSRLQNCEKLIERLNSAVGFAQELPTEPMLWNNQLVSLAAIQERDPAPREPDMEDGILEILPEDNHEQ